MWNSHVLTEIGLVQKSPIELICDNKILVHLVYNSMYHSKTKHMDLNSYYNWNLVEYGAISLEYYPTK